MKKELFKKGIALGMSLMLAVGTIAVADYHVAASKSQKIATEHVNKTAADLVNIMDYSAHPSATEFSVSDVEEMEKLAELVNSGAEDFEGKTVKMTENIYFDKSKKNNHVPIGNGAHPFKGIFDGDNHAVFGMQITINDSHISEDAQKSDYYGRTWQGIFVGLFGTVAGKSEIKNIRLKDSVVKGVMDSGIIDSYYALLVGNVFDVLLTEKKSFGVPDVKISNCHIDAASEIDLDGERRTNNCYVGSIAGYNRGLTQYCTNGASISSDEDHTIGGIVGYGRRIKICYNYGNIIGKQGENIAGIVGNTSIGSVEECVNTGNVTGQSEWTMASGISSGSGDVINCYNTGKVTAPKDGEQGYIGAAGINEISRHSGSVTTNVYNAYNIGAVSGKFSASIYVLNCLGSSSNYPIDLRFCYWLTGTNKMGFDIYNSTRATVDITNQDINECTQKQMQAQSFVDQLNANSVSLGYGEVWQADTEGINNGYPILKNVPYSAITQGSDAIVTEDPEEGTLDTTEVAHFFTDYTRSRAATKSTIRIYANGGNVAVAGTKEKKNYKSCILYTDILASYKYSMSAKGKLSLATGKVIVGMTTTDEIPTLQKGKIVDKEAAKVAVASIKHGQITVTAKNQSGKVYLWAIDTGDAGVTACIPVTVKMAPSKLELYSVSDTDSSFSGTGKAYRTAKIKPGSSTKVYLYPSYKDGKTVKKTSEATYTVSVDSKALPYFAVSKLPDSPYGFEISAKKLKNGKSVTGKIVFTCNQNGKKVIFNATAIK